MRISGEISGAFWVASDPRGNFRSVFYSFGSPGKIQAEITGFIIDICLNKYYYVSDISQKEGLLMPRKQRCRQIEGYPDHWEFAPEEVTDPEPVILSLDEFETIRLLDREGMTQEQCADRMGVARTTVTAIYESARKKVAEALTEGKRLLIRGGNYRLNDPEIGELAEKSPDCFRIAVTYENGRIFPHFGRTGHFKIYDTKDSSIISEKVVKAEGCGHGALAGFLKAARVDLLICGGIGMGARNALSEAGIRFFSGVSGEADSALEAFFKGTLSDGPGPECGYHRRCPDNPV